MLFLNEFIQGIEEWNLFEKLEEEQSDATGWAGLGLDAFYHIISCEIMWNLRWST